MMLENTEVVLLRLVEVDQDMDNNNTVEVVHNNLDLKEVSMAVKNITSRQSERKLITPIKIKMETSIIDTHKEVKPTKTPTEKQRDERKSSLWNLKENRENITNTNATSIVNTKKE